MLLDANDGRSVINARDAAEKTPLWYAVNADMYSVSHTLLRAGCDVNPRVGRGAITPYRRARFCFFRLAELLHRYGGED